MGERAHGLKLVASASATLLGGWALYWGYLRRDGQQQLLPYRSMRELNEKAPFVRYVRGPFLAHGLINGYTKLDEKLTRAIAGTKSSA